MDDATPNTGADGSAMPDSFASPPPPHSIEAAAEKLKSLNLFGSPPKGPEKEPEGKAEPSAEATAKDSTEPAKPEATAEAAPDGEVAEAVAAPQEPETPDLAKIAKFTGLPESAFLYEDGVLRVKTKVDGQDGKVSLADALKSFQLESSHTKRFMELAEKQKAFEKAQEEATTASKAAQDKANRYLDLAAGELLRDFKAVDWASLAQTDPVAYSSLWIQYQQRITALNSALAERDTEAKAAEAKRTEADNQRLIEEEKLLLSKIAEWADAPTRKKESAEIVQMLKETDGLIDEEISAIGKMGHKAVILIRDAYRYRQLQKQKAAVENKVRAAPNLAKPGTKAPASESSVRDQMGRFAKEKSVASATPLLTRILERQAKARR